MRIILIGPPGVGKGTQAALLEQRHGARQLSSGAIFREELDGKSELGEIARGYMQKGELVPDDVTIGMMRKHVQDAEDAGSGFILDGFPRTVAQALALDRLLAEMGIVLDGVVSLEVADEEVVARLSSRIGCASCGEIYNVRSKPPKIEGRCDECGGAVVRRKDDEPQTIRDRLKVFHTTTAPVIEHYDAQGVVSHVSAEEPEQTYREIIGKLTG